MSDLHEAAKAAALAERDRLAIPNGRKFALSLYATDYVVGRIVEAALAVIEGRPVEPGPAVVDAASEEVGNG